MGEKRKESIITKWLDNCMICYKPKEEMHHALYGNKHKLADQDKLLMPLCQYHHQDSKNGVHYNMGMKVLSQQLAQACWQRQYLAEKLASDENLGHQSVEDWIEESADAFKARYGEFYL